MRKSWLMPLSFLNNSKVCYETGFSDAEGKEERRPNYTLHMSR